MVREPFIQIKRVRVVRNYGSEPFIQIIRVRILRNYGKRTLHTDYKG